MNIFEKTLAEARKKLTNTPADDLQAILDEACQTVSNEMRLFQCPIF